MPKKWNDAKPVEKLLFLFTLLLFDGREVSLKQVSSTLGCPKQSITRLNRRHPSPLHRLQKFALIRRGSKHLPGQEEGNKGAFALMKDKPVTACVRMAYSKTS